MEWEEKVNILSDIEEVQLQGVSCNAKRVHQQRGQRANLSDVGSTIAVDLDKSGATNLDDDILHTKTKKPYHKNKN